MTTDILEPAKQNLNTIPEETIIQFLALAVEHIKGDGFDCWVVAERLWREETKASQSHHQELMAHALSN